MSKRATLQFVCWLSLLLVLGVPLLYIIEEWRYAKSVSPSGVESIQDHIDRLGMPELVVQVKRRGDSTIYYEFSGFPGGKVSRIALPSDRPAYIYDSTGMLVDWCADPGDTVHWHNTWRPSSEADSNVLPIVEQLLDNGA